MKASVVGGGIAGLSTAYFLAKAGYEVSLYEMEYPGYGASGKSAGIVVTIFEEDLLRHVIETYRFYRNLPESSGRVSERLALWITGNRGCIERLRSIHEKLGLRAPDAVKVDLGVEFDFARDYYTVIRTFIVDTGWVINTLYSKLLELNVNVINRRVMREGSKFYAGGKRLEGIVVISVGPWARQLLPEISNATILYRCQIASVEGPTPNMVIEDDSLNYYLVPVSPNRFNIGDGSNTVIDDPFDGFKPDPEDTYNVLEMYARRVPRAWESRIIQIWSAPCITTGDGYPLVSEVLESVYIITGFDGAGMSLAPSIAKVLVDHIIESKPIPAKYSRLDRPARTVVEPYNLLC